MKKPFALSLVDAGGYVRMRFVYSLTALAVAALAAFMFWPLSLADVIAGDMGVLVTISDMGFDGSGDITNYVLPRSSEKLAQLRNLLNEYVYHRLPRTFFGDGSLKGTADDAGYRLHLHTEDGRILISHGSGYIIVDGRGYRLGYWGNKKALKMMSDVRSFVENNATGVTL